MTDPKKLQTLAETLEHFGSALVEASRVLMAGLEDQVQIQKEEKEVEVKTTKKKTAKKKTAKKTAKKTTEKKVEETPAREVFTKDDTPTTAAEKKLFKEHWEALGKEGQTKYISGEINSLGEVIETEESHETSEDDFEIDDLPELDEKEYTLNDIRRAAKEKAAMDGTKSGVVAVFKKFGYKKIDEVKPEDFNQIYSELS